MENSQNDKSIVLSVIIICHNQKEVVRRCIDSVLRQETTFRKEVIVSDDRSTDGTREMLLNDYKGKVIATFFNSDNCNASFTLERSGYNRLNGLKLAHGKYIIHTDGDDFFTSTDLFQTMVDTLEAHPECSLCCQNYCVVDANNVNAPHIPQNNSPYLKQDCIISVQEFFANVKMLVNACYCLKRANFNDEKLWGGTYDDNYITCRYIGCGKVAILNRCDFVYVKYGTSTCATMKLQDKRILFHAAIGMTELAPTIAGAMVSRYSRSFMRVSQFAVLRKPVSNEIQSFCGRFDGFLFHNLKNEFVLKNWLRYCCVYFLSAFMTYAKVSPKLFRVLLYRLAIGKIDKKAVI